MTQIPEQPSTQLCMKRHGLEDLPEVSLPEAYTIRTSQPGDAHHWAKILRESFKDKSFDESYFARQMKAHPAYQPERIFFVCAPDGVPCGTASAYRQTRFGDDTGYLHFVALRPVQQGRRLGAAVSLAALHKFRSEGLNCAVLQTDDFRLAAIKTYLRLGFLPLVADEDHTDRWNAIFRLLGETRRL